MTIIFEDESERELPFSIQELAKNVAEMVLEEEQCPYEVEVNLLLTTNQGIQEVNRETRKIDLPTDVLSFPFLEYETPGDFSFLENEILCFHPESGRLLLGDILLSVDKIYEQAEAYQHSLEREFAFLIAHSMLHLCGYDHMEEEEAATMERKQEKVLGMLGITREN